MAGTRCHPLIVSVGIEALWRDLRARRAYSGDMTDGPFIAEAASLIGDPARANILAALMGGRALTATELALSAGVAQSTASGHLAKLVEGKLASVVSQGRHRYYRLASPAVACALEDLMALAADGPRRHRPRTRCDDALAHARTCYDHFAGRLGVALADSLANRKQVILEDGAGLVTSAGRTFLKGLGVEIESGKHSRRALCRPCLDWSERRWHIGGALGAAIASRFSDLGWTVCGDGSRAVTITTAGTEALAELFGIRL